nr:immunoglobulin heavy chain junction region [Mus musculus]
CAREGGSDYW